MKLIAGNANRPLAESIARILKTELSPANITTFGDLEIRVEIQDNVRGADVFLIQSTSQPANDYIMELLITIDALARASAARITAVMPYFGYARQDRKEGGRTPISAKLIANLITVAGADRVLTVDLHAGQLQGFFDIPTDNLFAVKEFASHISKDRTFNAGKITIVSPDAGGVVRARALAKRLDDAPLAIVDKRRDEPGKSRVMNIIGNVEKQQCIIFDDIVDSGSTLCNAAVALKQAGAARVDAFVTHGVLSGGAIARIGACSALSQLVVTDSIKPHPELRDSAKFHVLPVAGLLAEAIRRIAYEESISSLFN